MAKWVLMITADPDVRATVKRTLMQDWKLRSAESLRGALQMIHKRQIGIVFCDQDAPKVAWRDVVTCLSHPPHRACVVVLSQSASRQIWEEATGLGGYDVLAKPLATDALSRVTNAGWSYWKSQRALFKSRKPSEDFGESRIS